ncbi:MAG: Hpt domain-containing protein [Bdellovibrionaceae bacterium]|nr:Hpt domain-containing protein [Pseudobdellovibrionaceae bacterium]MDW8190031.1 Hpt domain-containing protein [Pseudobdellovibrionaceae bacterium]
MMNPNLKDLQTEYLQRLIVRLKKISNLLNLGHWSELETEFHKLKGNGKTLGFSWVSELAAPIEQLLKTHRRLGTAPSQAEIDQINSSILELERLARDTLKT